MSRSFPPVCLNKHRPAMGDRQKPKYRKHRFAFGGLLVCGTCGCLVTAERKKGRYVYYHCTKSRTACDERYYRERRPGASV